MARSLTGKAKCGLVRDGKRIYLIFECPTEYDAIELFDVWSMEDVDITFKGPKQLKEVDNVK